MLFWLGPEPGRPGAGLRLASSTASQGAEPETSFAGAAGAVHWLGRVALRHTNVFQSAPVARLPHAPRLLAPTTRAVPPLRPGKPVRDGERSASRAMLVHAARYQPSSIAGAAPRGARYRLYLPHLRSTGASRSTQRGRLSDDMIDPFFLKETEYADVPH
jgi:hypothetical protein